MKKNILVFVLCGWLFTPLFCQNIGSYTQLQLGAVFPNDKFVNASGYWTSSDAGLSITPVSLGYRFTKNFGIESTFQMNFFHLNDPKNNSANLSGWRFYMVDVGVCGFLPVTDKFEIKAKPEIHLIFSNTPLLGGSVVSGNGLGLGITSQFLIRMKERYWLIVGLDYDRSYLSYDLSKHGYKDLVEYGKYDASRIYLGFKYYTKKSD